MLTFASYWFTVPSSWPETMYLPSNENPATVAFASSQTIRSDCSLDCSASGSGLMSYTTMVLRCPTLFSVTPSSCMPSGLNSTRLIALPKSHVFSSLPVFTSQSRIVLSAAPDAMKFVLGSTSTVQMAP